MTQNQTLAADIGYSPAACDAARELRQCIDREGELIAVNYVFTFASRNRILNSIELVKQQLTRVNSDVLRELATLMEIATVAVFKSQRHSNRNGFAYLRQAGNHLSELLDHGQPPELLDPRTHELMESIWTWLEANH